MIYPEMIYPDMENKAISQNPATEQIIAEHNYENIESALSKISKLKESFLKWRRTPIEERVEVIRKIGQDLRSNCKDYAKLITEEMGKVFKEAVAEVEKCAFACEYFAEKSPEFLKPEYVKTDAEESYIEFDPLGVILAIMPWNFPFWQVIRCAVPAIAAGNVIALKHSPNTFLCAKTLEKIFNRYLDMPILLNLFLKVEDIKHIIPIVDGVSLTGSVRAGESVGELAGKNIKPIVLELGGSDPFIIFEDADLNLAIETAIKSRMTNCGQVCIAAKRFFVSDRIYDKFLKGVISKVEKLKIGNPLDDVDLGPLARRDLLENAFRIIRESNGKLIYGGRKIGDIGFFMQPTIIVDADINSAVFKEETFAPIMPISVFKTDDQAIELANKSDFGLGATIFTKNIQRAKEIAKYIEAGNIAVNRILRSDPRLPFGGVKKSGVGRELSRYGILEFVNIKSISIDH